MAGLATALALYLPFWLAAPGPMTRMVVLDQLGRTRAPVSVTERLAEVLGGASSPALAALTVAATLLLVVLALLGRRPLGRWAAGLFALQLGVLLAGPPFFSFYAAYVVPALALVLAAAVATVGDALGRLRLARPALAPAARVGALALLGVGLLPLVVVDARTAPGVPLPAGELQALTATSRCVTSDSAGLLVLLDRLGRNLSRDCPVLVDVSGITYDSAARERHGHHVPRAHNIAWQRTLRRYLLSGGPRRARPARRRPAEPADPLGAARAAGAAPGRGVHAVLGAARPADRGGTAPARRRAGPRGAGRPLTRPRAPHPVAGRGERSMACCLAAVPGRVGAVLGGKR